MEFAPHEQRVITERDELQEKLEKLKSFILDSPIYRSLPIEDSNLLSRQLNVMNEYLSILNERIGRFVK